MKLQVSSQLAIFAVLELSAAPERQLSVAEIGEKYGISSHHLAKVMHVLGRAGVVRAVRGAHGGYQFSGNPRRVTLLDVIQLFEPLGEDRHGAADAVDRALGEVLDEIDQTAAATFGSITISTLLQMVRRAAEKK